MAQVDTTAPDAPYDRHVNVSAADTAVTIVLGPDGSQREVLRIIYEYSATPVQTGVTVVVDAVEGAAYDHTIYTGAANLISANLSGLPYCEIMAGDTFTVTCPAAGGAITCKVIVYTRRV